jgi:hypothetical protein
MVSIELFVICMSFSVARTRGLWARNEFDRRGRRRGARLTLLAICAATLDEAESAHAKAHRR